VSLSRLGRCHAGEGRPRDTQGSPSNPSLTGAQSADKRPSLTRNTSHSGADPCPRVQVEPYCTEHAGKITAEDYAGKAPKRRPRASVASGGLGYDRRWMKLRARKLRHDPTREWPDCDDDAKHVHHIDGLGCRGPRGYDVGNLMALCAAHHNPISARQRWAGEPVPLPRRYRVPSFLGRWA
jgi:hypothetical protein